MIAAPGFVASAGTALSSPFKGEAGRGMGCCVRVHSYPYGIIPRRFLEDSGSEPDSAHPRRSFRAGQGLGGRAEVALSVMATSPRFRNAMKGQANPKLRRHKPQRALRGAMTDAERLLWRHLRGRQLAGRRFRRQHPFLDYVLDFVCLEARLVVELDGGQHLQSADDAVRDARLRAAGFAVLRFWNHQVLGETEAVLGEIHRALTARELP